VTVSVSIPEFRLLAGMVKMKLPPESVPVKVGVRPPPESVTVPVGAVSEVLAPVTVAVKFKGAFEFTVLDAGATVTVGSSTETYVTVTGAVPVFEV
jgi:hypothetical protein